jgi:hypothetical protein
MSSRSDSGSFEPPLILFERKPVDLSGFGEEATFEIPHMGLGQVLVLADEDDGRNPEFLRLVLLKSITNDLRFADVSARGVCKRIVANEDIDACLVEFLASKKFVQFGAGCCDSLAGPVRDLGSAQTLRFSAWKEEFDSSRCHVLSICRTRS